MEGKTFGDVRLAKQRVPSHDILCAGFPCQPFSKSGSQKGLRDPTRGTLFHEVAEILQTHRPNYVLLENVGNFERHDKGRTWAIVKLTLLRLGYDVRGTTHIETGGHGLVSPHHLGFPHNRERFFVVASRVGLPRDPFPPVCRNRKTELKSIVQNRKALSELDREETALSPQQVRCIDHWNALIQSLPASMAIQSPIWGDELTARYPFEVRTPFSCSNSEVRDFVPKRAGSQATSKRELLDLLPSYARSKRKRFPKWKVRFIRENRNWFREARPYLPDGWSRELRKFPASLRKFEWNCQGDERDLWKCVLQFRPSGLRAKRYTSSPSLVAMTSTQVPILGPKKRFLTRVEGLRLQGFPDSHLLPKSRESAFTALGNAVHTGVVEAIARRLLNSRARTLESFEVLLNTSMANEIHGNGPAANVDRELAPLLAALRGDRAR